MRTQTRTRRGRPRAAFLHLALVAVLVSTPLVAAEPPGQFHYQGRVIVADAPLNGDATIVFQLFDDAAAGNLLYEEQQTVTAVDGFYSAYIGSVTPIAPEVFRDHSVVYLAIAVNGQALLPRERIVSVGYALNAHYAEEALVAHRLVDQPAAAVVESPSGGPAPLHVGSNTNVAFHVHMNDVAQSITSGIDFKLDWKAAEFDTASAVNLTTDRFMAPVDGYYRLTAQVYLSPTVLRTLDKHDQKLAKLQIRLNGTNTVASFVHRTSGKGGFSLAVSRERFLNQGDYVEVYVSHLLSPDVTLVAGGKPGHSYFSGFLMQQ